MVKTIVTITRDTCKGCELCISVCPKHVLAVDKTTFNSRGVFPAMIIKAEDCVGCLNCALMCPDGAITIEREEE